MSVKTVKFIFVYLGSIANRQSFLYMQSTVLGCLVVMKL